MLKSKLGPTITLRKLGSLGGSLNLAKLGSSELPRCPKDNKFTRLTQQGLGRVRCIMSLK